MQLNINFYGKMACMCNSVLLYTPYKTVANTNWNHFCYYSEND